eukprot:GHVS01075725.1.p1 GENE.GHVS01075725.1~~GHVS01075725.1.p1  ORF type:complete len:478 (-),score=104.80 GHVS01075725.1:581-1927(-)
MVDSSPDSTLSSLTPMSVTTTVCSVESDNNNNNTDKSTTTANCRWNSKTQTPHGGQEWRSLSNYIEDFSVTTNPLGTPLSALSAATAAVQTINHYPPADFEPAIGLLADFLGDAVTPAKIITAGGGRGGTVAPTELLLRPTPATNHITNTTNITYTTNSTNTTNTTIRKRLLLGNGASECIDLVCRVFSKANSWRPGPSVVQYKEYERCCLSWGKQKLPADDSSAELLCIVNPCNPTGDFMPVETLKSYISSNCLDGSAVVVDESMQPWIGSHWLSESLVSQGKWLSSLYYSRRIRVYVIHSWTKLWSCPGVRLGSVLAPTEALADELRKIQVPWSVNSMALAFLADVVNDEQYLLDTWEYTTRWRQHLEDGIKAVHPSWTVGGVKWLSFLWIDTNDEGVARRCVDKCRTAGVPIRWCGDGYGLPTYIRIGVRKPELADVLLSVLGGA